MAPQPHEFVHLVDRFPKVTTDELLAGLAPSPRFQNVSFDTYIPDPSQPSQAEAVERLRRFAAEVGGRPSDGGFFGRMFGKKAPKGPTGIYLDGGFGVGKTHLLASLFHAVEGKAAFGTFVEYTNLVGALSFRKAVEALSQYSLVCIDEFELDDPGDTVLMSRLMRELSDAGVKLAATSNTLPGSLGEGRFAAEDFKREIQALASQFEVLRIDGEDYRHRGLPTPPTPIDDALLDDPEAHLREDFGTVVALDDFDALLAHLNQVHPSRYRQLIEGVNGVVWRNVTTIESDATALRLVVLADRLYDLDVPVLSSGVPFDRLFTERMLKGGYLKKYYRAISRLTAMARAGGAEG
ncbi:cell division protein ZapE [Arthrobacter sp. UM1]|uniref:cell division protein ZapE n=1 Tax=Arthrobacter sp. UM1 TaxID=2766776 RepID=UPI001CF6A153|nr:cell division protein ZapE [Arthrobacter sp. UM1]MCB4207636.1 cell division protein ZapE [Arthrobacter sp. UM1]